MPRFSIILVHFQGATPHRELMRGVNSIFAQTNSDYELLAYHNGPLIDNSVAMPIPFICSETNLNDWGFASRDRGIREATGDYIIHFNSDNVLYPDALEKISAAIDRPPRLVLTETRQVLDQNAIIIFACWLRGFQRMGEQMFRFPKNPDFKVLLTGNPPREHHVDAMQAVIRREIWLAEGGWYDKSHSADGKMIQKMVAKYGYRAIEDVLGEHY